MLVAAAFGARLLAQTPAGLAAAWLLPAAGCALLGGSFFLRYWLGRTRDAGSENRRWPRALQDLWRQHGPEFQGYCRAFFAKPVLRCAPAFSWVFVAWCLEIFETALILRALHADLTLPTAAVLEVATALARHIAFFVPAGVGVQDAGYAFLLHALRVEDALALGVALALLKRGRELLFAAMGALSWLQYTLAHGGRPEPSPAASLAIGLHHPVSGALQRQANS